jgi:hypothetical protein
MRRLFEWLKIAVEKRPMLFVLVGGTVSYASPVLLYVLLNSVVKIGDWSFLALLFAPAFVVFFHWFVARYEKKSWVAQVLAICPAIFFTLFAMLLGAALGNNHYFPVKDPGTGECRCIRD